MRAIELSLETGQLQPAARNSIGGGPILPLGMSVPQCTCGQTMLQFLHFDIPTLEQLSFAADCHLSIFMCPVHNECSDFGVQQREYPPEYWNMRHSAYSPKGNYAYPLHFRLSLFHCESSDVTHADSGHLQHLPLRMQEMIDQAGQAWWEHDPRAAPEYNSISSLPMVFKIGGLPNWFNEPSRSNTCACGARMRFLCQIPENFAFPKTADAPSQPDSFSYDDYCLFLGNAIYIFACEARCHPHALVAYNDN